MTTKKIYGPWIKWHGGECPVPSDTIVKVTLRSGTVLGPDRAAEYEWRHIFGRGNIVEYCVVTEQPDLEAAEKLLRDNGYAITPPEKPRTFEDVTPLTEAPPEGMEYWVVSAEYPAGVLSVRFSSDEFDGWAIKRRMAYLDKEHALIAARHIFGLKGGEL